MRQPARPHRRRLGADGGAGSAGRRRRSSGCRIFRSGDTFGADLHLDQHVFVIAEPEAVALEAGRRIDQLDAGALDARLQPRQILGIAAERQMMQRLGLALHHRAPAVLMAEGLDRQRVAVARDVEAEIAVEILRDIGVGHRQHELVERMHAESVGFLGRRDVAANGGHRYLRSRFNEALSVYLNSPGRTSNPRRPPITLGRPSLLTGTA